MVNYKQDVHHSGASAQAMMASGLQRRPEEFITVELMGVVQTALEGLRQ